MADSDDIVQNVKINVESDSADSAFDQLKSSLSQAFDAIKSAFSSFDFSGAWDQLKDAGAKAFESLKQIGTESLQGLAQVAEANSEAIGHAVLAIGAAVAAVGVALTIATKLMYNFVESTSQVVNAMGELADKTNTAIESLSGMQSFFAQAGVGPKEFEQAFNHLGQTVSSTWASIKQDVTEGADKVAQTHIAAAQATIRLQDAQRDLQNTSRDLAKQQRDDANAVADAQTKLAQAQIAKDKSLGIDTTRRETDLKNQKLDTDLARAKQTVTDAQDKQDEDFSKASEERIKRQLALKQAQLSQQQAERAAGTAQRNDIGNITKSVQDLAGGNQEALRNFSATADNILKGIVASAAQSGAAIKNLGVDFSGLSDTGPKVKDVLLQLGLVLNNINDPILRNQVAFKALGNASQDFINALKTGGIDEFIQKMGVLGGAVDETDKKVASNFINSLTKLQDTLGNIGVKISTAFGPQFTEVLDHLNNAFESSRANIVRFADTIASITGPPLKLVATSIDVIVTSLNTLSDLLRNIKNLILGAFGLSDIPLIKTLERLYNILKAIAEIITGDLKKGLEDLKKESAKELEEDFKKKPDENASDASKANAPAPRVDRDGIPINKPVPRDADGFPVGTPQTQKDAINFRAKQNEDEAARSRGIDPNAQQSTIQRAGQLLDPRPLINQLFGGGASTSTSQPSGFDRLLKNPSVPEFFGGPQLPQGGNAVQDLVGQIRSLFSGGGTPASTPQQPGAPASSQQSVLDALQGIGAKLQQNIDSHFQGGAQPPGTPGAAAAAAGDQSNILQDFFGKISGFLTGQQNNKVPADEPGVGGGIRGSLDDASAGLKNVATAADAPVSPLQQLATAASEAATQLAGVKTTGTASGGNTVSAATGGLIRGAGTGTSDSINVNVSDGEYIMRSAAVRALGVDFLHALNRGVRGYADGGVVSGNDGSKVGKTLANANKLGFGEHSIVYDPDTNGAYIDGILHTPPDPILNDPNVRSAIEQSKQGMKDQASSRTKHSDFTGVFGGHVFGESGSYAEGGHVRGPGSGTSDSILARLSNNEFVQPERATRHYGIGFMEAIRNLSFPRFNIPQFALGGLVSPRMPRFAGGGVVDVPAIGAAGAVPHLGTVDLTTDYGTPRVYADKDTIGELKKAAVVKNRGSQKKPGWM